MIHRAIPYPRTHRIAELLDLMRDSGIVFPNEFEILRALTPFAVEFRYDVLPEESEEPLDKIGTRAAIDAMREWVEKFLTY